MADNAKTPKPQIAKHTLFDVNGAVCEDEDSAHGVGYELLAGGTPIRVMWNDLDSNAQRKYGLFGLKTQITNETSQSRQKHGAGVTPEQQLSDAMARIELVKSGTWVDRTREAFKPDAQILAKVFADQCVAEKKVSRAQADEKFPEWLRKATEDAEWIKKVYALPVIKSRYIMAASTSKASASDLM